MDFAFGTLSTDELRLYHHRLLRQGVRHGHAIAPRQPRAGEPITLFATTGVDVAADGVACYYTVDGSEPAGARGSAGSGMAVPLSPQEAVWDSFAWGYGQRWSVTLPGLPAGTRLRYRIGAWSAGEAEIFADYPDLKLSAENAAHRHFSLQLPPDPAVRWGETAPGTIFSLTIDRTGPPAWAREAIIYHLMIDRFNPGGGRGWRQTADLGDFCGGTLPGVTEKLDYIAGLGANCLWLSPLWLSPSSHGYDTADYRTVQPQYGSADDLRRLIDAAHGKGLRVLFDMACNHISSEHPLFQQALQDSTSPYRRWFTFDDSDPGYRGFFNVAAMPEINLTRPDARDWMIDHARYWLREFDIDGYRLDYAAGAGPDFWSYFVDACRAEKKDAFFFGEIIDTPDMLQPYVGRLDGVLDFHVNHALRQTFAAGSWSTDDLQRFLARHRHFFPADFIQPAFIDNHDMDRFLFIADGRREALLAALEALLTLPNPPVIYYGTEVGLSQRRSTREGSLTMAREPMPWGAAQDADLLAAVQAMIARRRETAPWRGAYTP